MKKQNIESDITYIKLSA